MNMCSERVLHDELCLYYIVEEATGLRILETVAIVESPLFILYYL